jgi:hypothetical protein
MTIMISSLFLPSLTTFVFPQSIYGFPVCRFDSSVPPGLSPVTPLAYSTLALTCL